MVDPVSVIVWIGVAVFAATAIISILYLVGLLPGVQEKHGQTLFKVLITEVAVTCVAVFAYQIQAQSRRDMPDRVPVTRLLLLEQAPSVVVNDDTQSLYIRSPDVSHARRAVDIQVATTPDFTSSTRDTLEAGVSKVISVGGRKYRMGFSQMGSLDGDPKEKQAHNLDFAFLSISREP